MSKVLVSGSLAYDHIMNFPDLFRNHFLPEKLHNINVSFNIADRHEHFGGTAGNIAYNLALLGEEPAIIATAGNDFDHYAEHLKKAGVDTSSIHIDSSRETSAAYVVTDRGDNQIAAFYPGAGAKSYGDRVPFEWAKLAIIAPGCLEDMHALPEIYRANKIPFFFDPGQTIISLTSDDLRNGITGAAVVFGNDYELAMITQKTGWQEADILKNAKALVITLGEEGSRIVTPNVEVRVSAVHAKENRDPTGAGDSYRAGYAKGFLAGLPPEQCAKIASVAAVYDVESVGTQDHHYTMEEFKARYEAAYNQPFPLST
ncbi:MAG TPA: carbohydrate kinase family protein [Candidatus Paceibacterota bacterium]|nr:carbohydrate kinase family protein [Candidatus Paceibacterota bacterium]